MEHKGAFFGILCLIHLLFYILFLSFKFINVSTILSYELSFFTALLVILASYTHYKKFILVEAKNEQKKMKYLALIFIKKIKKFPKNIKFTAIKDDVDRKLKQRLNLCFFALCKLIAYAVLVGGFLFLHHQKKLNILSYMSGIASLLICLFMFALYIRYEPKKNHQINDSTL